MRPLPFLFHEITIPIDEKQTMIPNLGNATNPFPQFGPVANQHEFAVALQEVCQNCEKGDEVRTSTRMLFNPSFFMVSTICQGSRFTGICSMGFRAFAGLWFRHPFKSFISPSLQHISTH
jgi:hypothetical protein